LSFTRFLTHYSADVLKSPHGTPYELVERLTNVLALALSSGDSFLPDAAPYDDLFYKLVEAGEVLTKLRDSYGLYQHFPAPIGGGPFTRASISSLPMSPITADSGPFSEGGASNGGGGGMVASSMSLSEQASKMGAASSIATLIGVSTHYYSLVGDSEGGGANSGFSISSPLSATTGGNDSSKGYNGVNGSNANSNNNRPPSSSSSILGGMASPAPSALRQHRSARQVSDIIKRGYDTLSIETREDLDRWEPFREANCKTQLKHIARMVVEDSRVVVASSSCGEVAAGAVS